MRKKLYAAALLAAATASVLAFGAPAQAAPKPECGKVAPVVSAVMPVKATPASDRCALATGRSLGLTTAGLIAGAATGAATELGK